MKFQEIQNTELPMVVFRQSIFFLLYRLVALEFFFVFLYLLIRIPKTILIGIELPFETLSQIQWFGIIYYSIVSILQIISILVVVLQYENSSFEIRSQLIARITGLFTKHTETYSLRNIESVRVRQTMLGRLLGYGDISFYNPSLGQNFYLFGIPNPHRYADLIEDSVARITQLRMSPTK